jgi:hypothetical protein
MKLTKLVLSCAILTTALGIAVTSPSYAHAQEEPSANTPLLPRVPANVNTTFAFVGPGVAGEIADLTREGISTAGAIQAIRLQSEVDRTRLLSRVEAALGSAYAGAWFEPGVARLHIGVTSPTSRRAVEAIVAQADLTSGVSLIAVRSTWAQLGTAQTQWNRRLAHLLAHYEATTSLAPQHNAVNIVLGSLVPSAELVALEHEASAATVKVLISVSSSPGFRATLYAKKTICNKFAEDKAYCEKPITSGVTIESELRLPSEKTETCTAGPMAIPKDRTKETLETYLLTAGHCISKVGEKWFAFDLKGVKREIGTVSEALSESLGDKADVAAIKIINPGEWTEGGNTPVFAGYAPWIETAPESILVPTQENAIAGHTNCVEGQTTGELCGTIEEVKKTLGKLEGMAVEKNTVKLGQGDSGAPWISSEASSPNYAEGVEVGELKPSGRPFYQELQSAFKELKLNLELLTLANETRPACPMMD